MSLALEFLTDYLVRSKTTQADFAKAAGIDPSLFTKLVQEEVGLNSKNVPKLLRGIHNDGDRQDFLIKYLQEQIPADLSDSITVRVSRPTTGALEEDRSEESLDAQIVRAFAALPSELYRRRVVRFLLHLRKDASLRDLFSRTCGYLEEADTGSQLDFPEPVTQSYADLARRDAAATGPSAKPNPGADTPPPIPPGKKRARRR